MLVLAGEIHWQRWHLVEIVRDKSEKRRDSAYEVSLAYGSLPPPSRVFIKNTDPTRLGGEQGGAAPQEKDGGVVAEARPQGTVSSPGTLSHGTAAIDRTVAGFTRTLRDTVVAGV